MRQSLVEKKLFQNKWHKVGKSVILCELSIKFYTNPRNDWIYRRI